MRIVAVAALNESGIDTVPIRPRELGLLRGMARVTQAGLRFHQQEIDIRGIVRTMACGATDPVCQMGRLGKILRLQAGLVALGADGCRLRRTQLLEANDLRNIASAVNVGLRWTMTTLTSMLVTLEQRGVRCIRKMLVPHFLVAGLADVSVGVLTIGRACRRGRGLRSRVTRLLRSSRSGTQAQHNQE